MTTAKMAKKRAPRAILPQNHLKYKQNLSESTFLRTSEYSEKWKAAMPMLNWEKIIT